MKGFQLKVINLETGEELNKCMPLGRVIDAKTGNNTTQYHKIKIMEINWLVKEISQKKVQSYTTGKFW